MDCKFRIPPHEIRENDILELDGWFNYFYGDAASISASEIWPGNSFITNQCRLVETNTSLHLECTEAIVMLNDPDKELCVLKISTLPGAYLTDYSFMNRLDIMCIYDSSNLIDEDVIFDILIG